MSCKSLRRWRLSDFYFSWWKRRLINCLLFLSCSSSHCRAFSPAVNLECEASWQSGSSDWWCLTSMRYKLLLFGCLKKKIERETVRWFNEEGNWNWGRCALCYWRMDTSEPVACVKIGIGACVCYWRVMQPVYYGILQIHWRRMSRDSWVIFKTTLSPSFDSYAVTPPPPSLLTVFVFTCAKVNLRLLPPSRPQGPAGGWLSDGSGQVSPHTLLSRGDSFKMSATILYLCLQLCLSLLLLLPLPLCNDCIRKPEEESSTHS